MLRWRLPSDTPRFSARGAVAVYPTSAGSPAAAGNDRDEDSAEPNEYAEELRCTDRRARPWLAAGLIGGQAQAMLLGVIGIMIIDRKHLRLRPDETEAMTGIVLKTGAYARLHARTEE